MPVAVTDLVMDVAITNFAEQRCEVLYSGPSHQPLTVDEGRYKKARSALPPESDRPMLKQTLRNTKSGKRRIPARGL
jgi:hypothetical protein